MSDTSNSPVVRGMMVERMRGFKTLLISKNEQIERLKAELVSARKERTQIVVALDDLERFAEDSGVYISSSETDPPKTVNAQSPPPSSRRTRIDPLDDFDDD